MWLQLQSENLEVSVLAFADDLVLASESDIGMRSLIRDFEKFLIARSLCANPSKCAAVWLDRAAAGCYGVQMRQRTEGAFLLMNNVTGRNETIPMILAEEFTRYLGLQVGGCGLRQPGKDVRGEVAHLDRLLEKSLEVVLNHCRKLRSLKSILFQHYNFNMLKVDVLGTFYKC